MPYCSTRTLHSDIKVTSDTRDQPQQVVKEGQAGRVLQAVITRASFRRLPRNGKSFFHHDVVAHQQPLYQETWDWKEFDAYSPYCNVTRICGHGCRRLQQRCVTAASPASDVVVSLALCKKHSQIRIYQCRPAPHHCGTGKRTR